MTTSNSFGSSTSLGNATSNATITSATPQFTDYYKSWPSGGLSEGSKAGIAIGIIVILSAGILAAFLCIRKRRRKRLGGRRNGLPRGTRVLGTSINTLRGVPTKNSMTETEEQIGGNASAKIRKSTSVREQPSRERYKAPAREVQMEPDLESESPLATPQREIHQPNSFAMGENENSSRNKYRMEDFDMLGSKFTTSPRTEPGGVTDANEEQLRLKALKSRIERIREEKDRLERIQELENMERETKKEIMEAQRRAGTG